MDNSQPKLTKITLWLMTIGAGLVVANNYYNQPLLADIAREMNVSEATISNVPMLNQVGYAAGLFLLIPLGDMFSKRKVIIIDFLIIIISLLIFAISSNVYGLFISSFMIGVSSVIPQMFVPMVAVLSEPSSKNKNVGLVMTGLLIGILGSRIFSGIVAEHTGWREVYYIAIGLMVLLWIGIMVFLPDVRPTFTGTYKSLMKSLFYYIRTIPSLRLASIRGGLSLAAFLAMWTTLTFHLEQPPFNAGSDVAGALGIVGIGGALSAALVGRIIDHVDKNKLIFVAGLLVLLSWIIFGVWGFSYAGLIVGIFILDIGAQSIHVSNQTIVFATNSDATNRLNTIYMTSYFIGGATGTLLGGIAWSMFGWYGVVCVSSLFVIALLVIHLIYSPKMKND